MLIVFKSPASGDVIMFEKNGKEMLGVLGKDPSDAKGIVTVEQLPGAIAAVMSQDPSLSPTQAWEALVSHTNEAGAPGADPDYGNGVLNLGWAIARNDTTRADTAVASLYYDNANEQLQIVLQNRSAQGVAGLDLHIDVNGTLQHYPVSWLAAGASAIVNLPLSSSQLSAAGKVTVRTELVNPSGLNDVLPANNVRTKVLNGPPNSSAR